jgi:murein DD-endopeptidase MepM/ murein hydrolase activator NlpD
VSPAFVILYALRALHVFAPAASSQDTSRFLPTAQFIRLYTNCDEERWPDSLREVRVPKTPEELRSGVARREALERDWQHFFAERAGDSIALTPDSAWVYPLAVRGRLLDNFGSPRPDYQRHEALDIFVRAEGVLVVSPVAGVVVASGDDWAGGYARRRGFHYEGGGLSRRAGNGVVIFEPRSRTYVYFAHLRPGLLVRTGDVVRAGQPLGRVGHTGNASAPGRGRHLHFAYKRRGTGCGVEGVLVPINPFQLVRAARARMRAP